MYATLFRPRPLPPGSLHVLGETDFRGRHDRFGLLPDDRLRHVSIIGKTGVGKSTLLANLIIQDLQAGRGMALLDPHGDLAETVLSFVPRARTNEVLVFAPGDIDHPVSFNVFRRGGSRESPATAASSIVAVFKKEWRDSWGPRLEHILRNAVLAVAESDRATLLLLYRFLTESALRDGVVAKLRDPVVRRYWSTEFASYKAEFQAEALSPVLNKLGAFVAHPIIRNIVAQERSRLDFALLMDRRAIVIANLSTGSIGEDASHLLGSLLLSSILLAGASRPRGGPPFAIYLDEFQHFVTDSLSTMLSEARKFGLGLVLAHQYLAQLPEGVRGALRGNVGTRIVFRIGGDDAAELEDEFTPSFSAVDLQGLNQFQMAVKLLAGGKELRPFSARTIPLAPRPEHAAKRLVEIRRQSRERFTQPKDVVAASIDRMLGN